ncbi:MAG: DUF4386 domain-containing protein [bacterium]
MISRIAETSPLVYARVAGILYLVHSVLVIFSIWYVPSILIVPGDVATTANNILASEGLFRSGFVSGLIAQTIYLLLVLVLYKLLKIVNKNHALLMVVFVLVAVPIAMLNLLNQIAALLLLSGADYLTAFEPDQLHTQVMFFLDLHDHGVFIAQIFWGLWLFPLGFLVFKSGFLPRILGVLLMIGCFGYLIECFQFFLFPGYEVITYPGLAVATIAEFSLLFWLLIKGVNVQKWHDRALASP